MYKSENKYKELIGKDLGKTSWLKLTQNDLDTYSNLTYDHNFIHKKDAKKKGSPFGDPIAHGLLTLSMLPKMSYEITAKNADNFSLKYLKAPINYGFNNIRFINPVYVDNEIRAKFILKDAKKGNKKNSMRYVYNVTIETKHKDTGKINDCLVAEWVGMKVYR